MISVRVRLYEELNRVLPLQERKTTLSRSVPQGTTLGHLVDILGLDRDEVDLALINSETASFADKLAHGHRVSLYPVFESFDIQKATALRDEPIRRLRFVMGRGLCDLAGMLEGMGYDCLCPERATPKGLARISQNEERILLTHDPKMAGGFSLDRCFCLRAADPQDQLAEVVRRFQLQRV